jgi:transposase
VANHGCVIGLISVKPLHHQDTGIGPETLAALGDVTAQLGMARTGCALTRDAGFDSQHNTAIIKAHPMKPGLAPNRRNAPTLIARARMFRWFDRSVSRLRYAVERTFGWHDTLRKLVISDDRLPEIRKGCCLLAYARINCRTTFNTSQHLLAMSSSCYFQLVLRLTRYEFIKLYLALDNKCPGRRHPCCKAQHDGQRPDMVHTPHIAFLLCTIEVAVVRLVRWPPEARAWKPHCPP